MNITKHKYTFAALAAFAMTALLPISAAWTYIAGSGAWNNANDKRYSGYVTDGVTWTIFVLDLGNGTWQLGAGTFGVDSGSGGSCQAGTTKTSTGIGSGALDVREIATDTGMTFSKIGPRCFYKHNAITAITIPDTVVEICDLAFNTCAELGTISLENGCPNLATLGNKIFEGSQKIAELDLGATQVSTLYRNFDNSQGFRRILFPETLATLKNQALGWITDGDLVIHFKGPMPTTIEANAIRSRSNNANQKWALKVDVNSKGTWPIRTDVAFADAQAKLPSVTGETFAEEDYLGYVYPSDLRDNGNGTSMKLWVFKEGTAAAVIPATMSIATTPGRTRVTLVATVDLGTSASATVSATVNGVTKTVSATQDGPLSLEFDGLALDTTYAWTATVQGADDAAATALNGTFSTLPPEVSLGKTSFTQPKDGLSATISVVVATLTSASADIEFTFDGAVAETRTVTAPGIYDFAVSGLTVGTTYDYSFVAVSSENADEAEVAGTLEADYYHWVYTPGAGSANGCPYTGTISDRNWRIRVWQCDPENHPDEFWLGVGSYGSVGVEAGTGDMDLSSLYADTLAAGTPVKIVKVNNYIWTSHNEFTGLVLPDTVREIGFFAFYGNRGLGSVDLSNTRITNIAARAFQDNYGCTNFFLPKTLQKVGGCAFAWGASKRVFHFRGDMPEVTLTTSDIGTGTVGGDQSFYIGNSNQQQAYCVDAVKYPRWKTDASTTLLYDDSDNSFPSGEASWVPAAVRAGKTYANGKKTYGNPFGNSTLGRGFDTSGYGRAYLIQETQIKPGLAIIIR
ncbi:MAG: leucine-rich repeat protein [Kiritimatiellae bacterium]|nr:leucine-rich repeat protein [Kiritimatiellia bacterium]